MTTFATPADTVRGYGALLQQQRADDIIDLYAPDAEIVPDQAPSLSGTAAIRAFYDETFRTISLKGDLTVTSEAEFGDIAIVRCEEPGIVTVLATGDEVSSYFREIFVLQRHEGAWKIRTYMFSQNPGQAV